jgi:hypothetical protein
VRIPGVVALVLAMLVGLVLVILYMVVPLLTIFPY